jgi:hypothetical protein
MTACGPLRTSSFISSVLAATDLLNASFSAADSIARDFLA